MEPMTIADIIKASYEEKPVDVQAAFNDIMQTKMAAAIDAKRDEIASTMYGSSEEDEEDFEYDESEVEADEDYEEEYEEPDTEEPTDEDF